MMKAFSLLTAALLLLATAAMAAAIPSGTLTFTITPTVKADTGNVTAWVPYPMSDNFQTIGDMSVSGNYQASAIYRDPASEVVYLFADWKRPVKSPTLVMRFHVTQKDRRNTAIKDNGDAYPELVREYLKATAYVPADDPQMKAIADKVTAGKTGTLEKARAVYDWVVENTFRDPDVKGCGLGQPTRTLNQCRGGGKCADLSTVFVTLARAAGIPAKDVYGLRLATPKDGDVTSGFHCWAEFYLPGTGWVMADPADVRKMMLVHKLELKDADDWRTFFWGGDDLFRLVLEKNGRGANLVGADGPINYFMYPAAQVDGDMLNYFDAKGFSYKVEFKQDK
ncbi:transglutaminase-like domain-containing protein [Desulfosarcina ovata]|nr:transglutaminase-like domain-containing protein [Desulfosarcina ovata]